MHPDRRNTHPSSSLVLYGTTACTLCDRLEQMVRPHLEARGLHLTKRDISTNPAWRQTFGHRIPVLVRDGQVLLEGRPEEDEIRALFTRSESRS